MEFEYLSKYHDKQIFDCGNSQINLYLQQYASQHAKKGISITHALVENSEILGFYTLSSIYLENQDLAIKGYPKQIPAMLIGKMGVDKNHQGQGFAKLLLSHAIKNVKKLSQDTGIAFVVIDAKDEALANFYEKFGFCRVKGDLRLILKLATIDKA